MIHGSAILDKGRLIKVDMGGGFPVIENSAIPHRYQKIFPFKVRQYDVGLSKKFDHHIGM